MLNFDPQGHDPGRVMILYESPSMKVHIYQLLHFYHKVNDSAKIWSLSAGLLVEYGLPKDNSLFFTNAWVQIRLGAFEKLPVTWEKRVDLSGYYGFIHH